MRNVVPPIASNAPCSPRLARPHSVANLMLEPRPERKWDRQPRPRLDTLAAPLTDDGRKMGYQRTCLSAAVCFELRGPLSMLALGEKEVILRCNAGGKRPSSSAAFAAMRRLGTATEGCPGHFAANPEVSSAAPRSLTGGKRLVCPLWDTESTWLWRPCSRPWRCEGKLILTCRPVLIAGTRHRGSSWRSWEVVGVGMILCHLMFADRPPPPAQDTVVGVGDGTGAA